jgi:hypothetical protein
MDGLGDEVRSVALGHLRDALVALSLPRAEQIRSIGPGCVACELLDDFDWAAGLCRTSCDLSVDQSAGLDAIDSVINQMDEADCGCFDHDVLERAAWERLRGLARGALDVFGWSGASLEPFREVAPGVWRRPPSNKP